jgi:RNA polymerase sigma-70 factor (family 1)
MNDYIALSDSKLIDLLRQSDHNAYTEIYNRYFYLMYCHAFKKLRDEEQAKDVIQELFANLWFKREFLNVSSNLGGYLFTAVRYKVFDLFSHQQVEEKYIQSLAQHLENVKNISTDHLIREKELRAYIEKEIQSLPSKMRQIFEMSRKEHLSYKEIAERTNTSENNVSKQVSNALRVLKTKLGMIA